jgi:hypothetical protein
MSAAVFISHSSKDRRLAERLCVELENRGITCWISSRDIVPGQNFQESIVAAIRTVHVMVLIFTSNANASDEIKKEVAIASLNRITVIPVRMKETIPSDAFAYELATRQWIDVSDDWNESLERLTNHLKNAISAKTGEHGATATAAGGIRTKNRARKRRPVLAGIAAGMASFALAASVSWWYLTPQSRAPLTRSPSLVSTAPSGQLDQYVGVWRNENPQTSGITKIEITNRLGAFAIHVWGKCHPTDCDNGIHPLENASTGDALNYTADFKFKVDSGSVAIRENGNLELTTHSHFTDQSRRPDYDATYRFLRDQE